MKYGMNKIKLNDFILIALGGGMITYGVNGWLNGGIYIKGGGYFVVSERPFGFYIFIGFYVLCGLYCFIHVLKGFRNANDDN